MWGCYEGGGVQKCFCPAWAPTELAAEKVALGYTPFSKYPGSPQGSRFNDSLKVGHIWVSEDEEVVCIGVHTA